MKISDVWEELIPQRDEKGSRVYDLAYHPQGMHLIVAFGTRVLVYDGDDGALLHSLKGHRDIVYCVDYAASGKRFASGSVDHCIIIWTDECEGILKYSHNHSIQCITFNPVSFQLASATQVDFGLWSPEQKAVSKYAVSSKVLCARWTPDGQFLALGQWNGHISVRDRSGEETSRIERNDPIWSLAWNPDNEDGTDLLAVGCWDKTLSFYQLSGAQVGKDRALEGDPLSIEYCFQGRFVLVAGTDKKITIFTKEGTYLRDMKSTNSWIWCIKSQPNSKCIGYGTEDGHVGMINATFGTVHGLYQDRYAYRDKMTDVIIQHLLTEQKVRIRTRDYVKRIAIYRDRLAIQVADRVIIYETTRNDDHDMHYRLKQKITQNLSCNLLVVTFCNLILCQETKLQLYTFEGIKEREWVMESIIRYIKVVGGPEGREGVIVGLEDGNVFKIFIDNKFPINIIKHSSGIRCIDISAARQKLALVDENSQVLVYDLMTKSIMFEDTKATSVAWNSHMEEMLCYSGNGELSIKTADLPLHKQKMKGFVVGFKGSKVFCLHCNEVKTIGVFQSESMHHFIDKKDFTNAFKVACLGVTTDDWKALALSSLHGMQLEIARKSFIRIRDVRYTELLNHVLVARQSRTFDPVIFNAQILAYEERFDDAAKQYLKSNQPKRAIEMFLDLREWDKARTLVEMLGPGSSGADVDILQLLRKQAEWLLEAGDKRAATEILWAAHEYSQAISIIGQSGDMESLMTMVRGLNRSQRDALSAAAEFFRQNKHYEYAKETYMKLDDMKSIMALSVECQNWDAAFEMARDHPELEHDIYLPHAEWLATKDRFEEAQEAYKRAGKPHEAVKMLGQLRKNACEERRYNDTSNYFWLLAQEDLKLVKARSQHECSASDQEHIENFQTNRRMAHLYFANAIIYRYTVDPFTFVPLETIFNSAQFIINSVEASTTPFKGISLVNSYVALAKTAPKLGAFKIARVAFEKLQNLCIPHDLRQSLDILALAIRSHPFTDADELLPVCYRCSTKNPLLNTAGDYCSTCGTQFIRSMSTLEVLPLVEFVVYEEIDHDGIMKLLRSSELKSDFSDKAVGDDSNGWKDRQESGADVLRFEEDEVDGTRGSNDEDNDEFMQQLMNLEVGVEGHYPPIRVGRKTLQLTNRNDVFIQRFACSALRPRYFRSLIPSLSLLQCDSCCQIFGQNEIENVLIEHRKCPFCQLPWPTAAKDGCRSFEGEYHPV